MAVWPEPVVVDVLRVDVRELTGPVDSVMFCLSKGLGAPVGSVLVGDREFIREARRLRQAYVALRAGQYHGDRLRGD